MFFDEQKNDTLKGLLIIPISKTQLYFSKIAVVIFMSLRTMLLLESVLLFLQLYYFVNCFCLSVHVFAKVAAFAALTDLNTETILQAGLLFLAGGVLVPLAMLPVIFLSNIAKGYVLPIGAALLLSCACRAYSVGDYGTAPTGECYGNLSLYFI